MLNFHEADYSSPVVPTLQMCKDYAKDGSELISFKERDFSDSIKNHGTVDLWRLNSLLHAGINPNFNIHTSGVTALDGYDEFAQGAEELHNEITNVESKEE